MFGPCGIPHYLSMKNKAENLPQIKVTEEEFIKLAMDSGMDEAKAKQTLFFCKGLGSEVMLGEQMVGLKKDEA